MRETVFLIQVTPSGKHRLLQRMIDGEDQPFEQERGLYDTHAQAMEAMDRIIKPVTTHYDANGDEIK